MKSILSRLSELMSQALVTAFGAEMRSVDPLVKAAGDMQHGDYQSNVAMSLAKRLGMKPRDVAQKLINNLPPGFAEMAGAPEIAGPGFINIRLRPEFLSHTLETIPDSVAHDRLGIEPISQTEKQTVIVDYSSPNVAKEMHVGHLRTTVIGDTIARVSAFQGHDVIRQNHLGDWGTQFGKIILSLWHLCMGKYQNETAGDFNRLADEINRAGGDAKLALLEGRRKIHQENLDRDPEGREFSEFIQSFEPSFAVLLPAYRFVNAVEEAADKTNLTIINKNTGETYPYSGVSRHVAAMLQGKTARDNTQELAAWRKAREATLRECNAIYQKLGVLLTDADICGESFYEPLLPGVVHEVQTGLKSTKDQTGSILAACRRDQGAVCVFLEKPDGSPAFKGPQGDPLPMIIQKSDGASLYATTDLAAILYRVSHSQRHPIALRDQDLRQVLTSEPFNGGLGADRVIYVVGAPQKLHFEMLFPTVRALGWLGKAAGDIRLEHVAFGSVLGDDRKMLRTRSGESVKLKDLLDEAVSRAEKLVRETECDPDKRRGFSESEIREIAQRVGIAAVKYADLSQNRNTDYVFDWDKMLAFQGNTAPYMLYAYARIRSIYRKAIETKRPTSDIASAKLQLEAPAERALAIKILQLAEAIDTVGENLLPSFLCEYLYALAGRFMTFYETCPVLQAGDESTFASRLRLCDLTARALAVGLDLLGIKTLERM